MFSKIWGHIKSFFKGCKNFFKKHFHKAVAGIGAGFIICAMEMTGIYAIDTMFLATASLAGLPGLILLCFGYFLVMFTSIMVGMEIFEYLWNKCQFEDDIDEIEKDIEKVDTKITSVVAAAAAATVNA